MTTEVVDAIVIAVILIVGLGLFWLSIYKGRPINSENAYG
jgi:hypothetical protein